MSMFNKDTTFGATFIGFAVSSVCFGVLSTQAYTYIKRYPLDRPFYKALVAALWFLECVDQAFIAHAIYHYVVTNWGNFLVVQQRAVWTLIMQVTLGAVTGAVVKSCFAMRVWRFSKCNVPVTGLIVILTLAQLGWACVYTVKAFQLPDLAHVDDLKLVGSLSLALGVATDIVTAAALCFFLRGLRTGYSQDDSLVNTLTIYAVNTGILTSAISLCTLILYDIMPDNFIFMAFYFVLSKLYAISFFATLNTRKIVRGRGTDGEHATMPTFLMVGKATRQQGNFDPEATTGSHVEVTVQQEVSITMDPINSVQKQDYMNAW
ncbi:hypothetical protein CERSUDRAFT_81328 [Gelatoporia subvermispora B]|uniref:DUF6534 domain-containing protein n=1 Tax=Ceriporiopsis subvermispora (strain B) TaxID=914234 RepID=M2PTJ5_CERS8|nr:hypothetical protein CERSUDRAFT_81328 [Gelatoporia subvermispora B]